MSQLSNTQTAWLLAAHAALATALVNAIKANQAGVEQLLENGWLADPQQAMRDAKQALAEYGTMPEFPAANQQAAKAANLVATTDPKTGQAVCLSLQNDEHQIIEVLWEAPDQIAVQQAAAKTQDCIDALRDIMDTGFAGGPQGDRARKALAALDQGK